MRLTLLIRGRQVIELVEGESDVFETGARPRGHAEAFKVDYADTGWLSRFRTRRGRRGFEYFGAENDVGGLLGPEHLAEFRI